MKAQEWIRVLTDSSTFCPVTVHTAKPPHRAFLSYQDIGLYLLGEWGNKNYKKNPRSPMEHDAFKWLAMNCSTDAKTNVSWAVLALLAHLLPSLSIVAGMTWEKSSLSWSREENQQSHLCKHVVQPPPDTPPEISASKPVGIQQEAHERRNPC